MTSAQQPLDSGFGMRSTPSEVIGGADLSGMFAVVTGGYSGLGLETTRGLATAGADVMIPARRPEHALQVIADEIGEVTGSITVDEMDLGDVASAVACGQRLVADGRAIDILINNAAIMACPQTRVGPGWEAQFATNHIGHYALTNTIYPLLAAEGGARVVSLSSTGHKLSDIRWDDVDFAADYDKWVAYGQAKTANALFAVQLDTLGEGDGVRAFAVHPGGIMTELQRHLTTEEMTRMGWLDENGKLHDVFKTPEQGASTSVWAATSPQLDGMGGVYCEDCDVSKVTAPDDPMARFMGVNAYAIDHASAERLWAMSAQRTGIDAFS